MDKNNNSVVTSLNDLNESMGSKYFQEKINKIKQEMANGRFKD